MLTQLRRHRAEGSGCGRGIVVDYILYKGIADCCVKCCSAVEIEI